MLYAPVCHMHQTWNGKASLLPNKNKHEKTKSTLSHCWTLVQDWSLTIGTFSVPTTVLDYQEIFYQNLLSSAWQLHMWRKNIQFIDSTGWNVHRLVMIVMKYSSGKSNEETCAVPWIKERKTLYISLLGLPCSYNNIDMLCDFMR